MSVLIEGKPLDKQAILGVVSISIHVSKSLLTVPDIIDFMKFHFQPQIPSWQSRLSEGCSLCASAFHRAAVVGARALQASGSSLSAVGEREGISHFNDSGKL